MCRLPGTVVMVSLVGMKNLLSLLRGEAIAEVII